MDNSVDYIRKGAAQRYVDILSDAGFKAVFGDQRNKDVLIDLLNVLLPEHRKIISLTYDTTEIPGFTLSNKAVRLDLRCTSQDGTRFIVEMQCYHQYNFFNRAVLYSSKVYDSGTDSGDDQSYEIPPVYFIGLVNNKNILPHENVKISPEKIISEYTFREKDTLEVPAETIFLIFVELNRFRKKLEDCTTLIDKWCFVLKYIGRLNELPTSLQQEVFERFFNACEIAKFNPEQKLSYEQDMISVRDQNNIFNTAVDMAVKKATKKAFKEGMQKGHAKGHAEGRAEGHAEGRAEGHAEGHAEGLREGLREGLLEAARNMKSQGFTPEIISRTTGLTPEEISTL